MEEWRAIHFGNYEVSNLGNVRVVVGKRPGSLKKASRSSTGYYIVGLSYQGKCTTSLVHRLVAAAFLGECPAGYEVNHKDGNKANNRLENLEYVTRKENARHAFDMGLNKLPTRRPDGGDAHWTRRNPSKVKRGDENGARLHPERIKRGSEAPASKLVEDEVRRIRELYASGVSKLELAAMFGVTRRNISSIVNNRSWRHV